MKSNELRIGNYINIPKTKQTVQIDYINSIGQLGVNFDVLGIGGLSVKEVEPIPLTEEWLVKFGAVKDNNEWDLNDLTFQYWEHDNTYHWVSSSGDVNVLLDYVHQLQNLYFALKGKELNEKTYRIKKT